MATVRVFVTNEGAAHGDSIRRRHINGTRAPRLPPSQLKTRRAISGSSHVRPGRHTFIGELTWPVSQCRVDVALRIGSHVVPSRKPLCAPDCTYHLQRLAIEYDELRGRSSQRAGV